MARLRQRETHTFTKSEIEQMQKLLMVLREESLSRHFYEKVARKFNHDTGRAGQPAIQWKQVQSWFETYQACPEKVISSPPIPPKVEVATTDTSVSDSEPVNFCANSKGRKLPDISDLEFEAKSSKDGAWYDVALFLTHRILRSGEPEVRVRFVGFGSEEDEWVCVKKAVRERSIPIEPSECEKIEVGHLVLCFQERSDRASYYDAHVLGINRRLHDIRGCRCNFLVRYDHDGTEETIELRRICRRP